MFENDEYTKPTQYVLKYKHNHINGNDSFSTFDFKTINVKEKCTLSTKWTNIMNNNNNSNNNNNEKEKEDNNLPVPQILIMSSLLLFEKKKI